MSSCRDARWPVHTWRALAAAALLQLASHAALAQTPYPGVGRPATPQEVAAWDTDVRPDFKGLPKGAGTVREGQVIWEGKCASCHGIFGESNEVVSPLIGGTTQADVKSGRVARLNDVAYPGRTTLMKLATVSTLWDYIKRAMPWNQPKSLSNDEVYAVTAYMLNLGAVLPDNFTLSDANINEVQALLPNRNGMTTAHGMWPGKGMGDGGNADVKALACMTGCAPAPKVASFLPEHARNSHGNLAEQQRPVGPQRGADTTKPASASAITAGAAAAAGATAAAPPSAAKNAGAAALALARKHACTACHGVDRKIVGPGFKEITARYAGRHDAEAYLTGRIKSGGQGVWGAIPMPPQTLPEADVKAMAQWLAAGASP